MNDRSARLADIVEFSCVDGPGNRFVVFLQGCNFDCVACHNPQTIPSRSAKAKEVDVEWIGARIALLAEYLSGITVSGGEVTTQAPFVRDLFGAMADDARLSKLTRFLDSNGCASPTVWERLLPLTDGVMLDLKALDPAVHHLLTGRTNDAVLQSIDLVAAAGKLYEVRLLLVPGFNDDHATIARTADWLAEHAPVARIKVIGFRSHGTLPPAAKWGDEPLERIEHAASVLVDRGFAEVQLV